MNYREEAMKIPAEDRPISKKEVSGLGKFFGIYGGEHIAATEFVIGATLVTLGVKATDIFGVVRGKYFGDAYICTDMCTDWRGHQTYIVFLSEKSYGAVYAEDLQCCMGTCFHRNGGINAYCVGISS